MQKTNKKTRLRRTVKLIGWILLVQFILVNVSAVLYAHKLTHFYNQPAAGNNPSSSQNIFKKTWKLFTGPRFIKAAIIETPDFPYETVQLKTADNLIIEAWYGTVDSAKGTVILFHGISANKSYLLDEANGFRNIGFNVLLVDLRTHGNSDGNNTTLGIKESEEVKLGYDYVLQKGTSNIYLYGSSMGAVVITRAIAEYGILPSGIILEMPFASLHDHLRSRARTLGFPAEPFGFLVTFWAGVERGFNGFNHKTCRYVKKVNCPVLMQWGELDNYVLKSETDKIFKQIASKRKKLVVYQNAAHESFLNNDPLKWRKEMSEFLQ